MKTIIGTWRLLSLEFIKKTGEVVYPFGKEVKGLLIYQSNGYMSGMISGEGRPNISAPATKGIPDKERLAISKNFIAYAGKYLVEGNQIIHNIEVSFVPNLMGNSSHAGTFSLKNSILCIASKQQPGEDDEFSINVLWEKVESNVNHSIL